ncbi:helix-turn-helix transcriptional regulator [Photobacterium profundum]|uniref:AraC family transcriptional regulator n=1 Tax=Photobacterium profundum TaxID=74109 RepID=UPI003D13912D
MIDTVLNNELAMSAIVIPKSYPDGHIIDWHHHDFSQLVFAYSGVMIVETYENLWVIPPQRAVWIPAGVLHKVSMHGQAKMRNFYVRPNCDRQLPEQSCVLNVSTLMRELLLHLASVEFSESCREEIERLIKVTLDQLKSAHQVTFYIPIATDPRLASVCNALLNDPANSRSLSEWAAIINISSRSLSRLYRNELGLSFVEYRHQVRLLEALKQLAKGKPVTTVAMEVGFSSLSAFNRLFKRNFGTTPGHFFMVI